MASHRREAHHPTRSREAPPTFRQIILAAHVREADDATVLAGTRDAADVLRTTIAYQRRLRLLCDKPAMSPVKVHEEKVQHRAQLELYSRV